MATSIAGAARWRVRRHDPDGVVQLIAALAIALVVRVLLVKRRRRVAVRA